MSAFKKKNVRVGGGPTLPSGTKLSTFQSSLLLTSYGMHSLDSILGGGIPVGTITLVLRDRYTDYANICLNYFLACGILSGNKVALLSFDGDVNRVINRLPGMYQPPIVKKVEKEKKEDLTIAWRYKNLPELKNKEDDLSDKELSYCPTLDLSTNLSKEIIEKSLPVLIDATQADLKLEDIYKQIKQIIGEEFSSKNTTIPLSSRKILRIGIHLIGSPLGCITKFDEIYKFLYMIKGLLRYSFAVMMVTLPPFLFEQHQTLAIQSICDTALEFQSFADHEQKQNNNDYQGFFYIHKSPRLNSLIPLNLKLHTTSNNLAFKLKRKKMVIETFHLPIEGGTSERRTEPPKKEIKEHDKNQPKKFTSNIKVDSGEKKNPLDF